MEGWPSVNITNKPFVESYFNTLKSTYSWSAITFKIFISDAGIKVYDIQGSRFNELVSIDIDSKPDTHSDVITTVKFWNGLPGSVYNLFGSDDDFTPSPAFETVAIISLSLYNASPNDYDSNKVIPNPISSIQAQAQSKVYITPTVEKRSLDLFLSSASIMTSAEFAVIRPTRQAARLSLLNTWKSANGWSG